MPGKKIVFGQGGCRRGWGGGHCGGGPSAPRLAIHSAGFWLVDEVVAFLAHRRRLGAGSLQSAARRCFPSGGAARRGEEQAEAQTMATAPTTMP